MAIVKTIRNAMIVSSALALGACGSSMPTLGGGQGNVVSGSAAGGNTEEVNEQLETCEKPVGTVAIYEDRTRPWWSTYRQKYPRLGSTEPVLRLMIQQSNCFVVVERGDAMNAMNRERQLMSSGQLRSGSNFGGGQMVAADFTFTPSVLFAEQTGGMGAALGRVAGGLGRLAGGQIKNNEAETNITVIENRSGVQVASANGSAKAKDFGYLGALWGNGSAGGGGGFSNTPEGKVVTAAFMDSYNQMVKALRNYKPQSVEGGLGKGGTLQIGGDDDPMPEATQQAPAPVVQAQTVVAPTTVAVVTQPSTVTVKKSHRTVIVDEYDEDALDDYYDALKGAVEHLGTFAGMTPDQVAMLSQQTQGMIGLGFVWGGPLVNRLETAAIELEAWPVEARTEGWRVYGKRIGKYNELFNKHRDTMIANKAFSEATLNQLAGISLLTEESFLAD